MGADWTYRGDYIGKRAMPPAMADEALTDPERVTLVPDPTSKSGKGVRTIGYSTTAQQVLTVITLVKDGIEYGVNCWPANDRDKRIYREGGTS
ncbi:Conserved protein of uncharacterised function%2C possible IS sequence associated protein [Mycobacteroides abscessus]|nr:Conserved protein of uncharacterised function%2C possible IS sequence associated protein [Mycobacteroides abscessus]